MDAITVSQADRSSLTRSGWRAWLLRHLQQARTARRVLLFTLLLGLPSLGTGLIADDHYHAARLLAPGFMPDFSAVSPFDLFAVSDGTAATNRALIRQGVLPWWTAADFRFQLWRPLAEFSHWIDYRLWPHIPGLMHAHHLLWVAALLAVALRFYRHILPELPVAVLAFALLALSANLCQTATWLAARNTLMAATLGIGAVLLQIRAHEEQRWLLRLAAWLTFALALLASEFGLGASAWLFAWALFGQHRDRPPLWRRLSWLMPYGLIMLGWGAVYVTGRFGTAASDFYVDPIQSPLEYGQFLLQRAPDLLCTAIFGVSATVAGPLRIGGAGWSVALILVAGFFWLTRNNLPDQRRFLLTGMLLSLLPIAAGPGGARTLLFVSLGLTPLIAALLLDWLRTPEKNVRTRRWLPILVWPLAICLLLGILGRPATAFVMRNYEQRYISPPAEQLPLQNAAGKQVVLLNPSSVLHAILYPVVRAERGLPLGESMYALASGNKPIQVRRVSENALELTPDSGFLQETAAFFVRPANRPLQMGERITLPGMRVEILSLNKAGLPASVRFEFDQALESSQLLFLYCDSLETLPFTLPAVGETRNLAPCKKR